MRILPRSLQARMLLLSAIATLAALLIAGWVISGLLERFVTEGVDRRLDAEVSLLAGTVDLDGRINRHLLDQRSGAFEDGPGWRWQIVGPAGTIGSSDFPVIDSGPAPPEPPFGQDRNPDGPHHRPTRDRLRPIDGGAEDGVMIHARQLVMPTRGGPVRITAAAPREVIRRPIRGALTPLLGVLVALAAILFTSAIVQLRIGLKPLRRLRDQVAAIRSGALDRVDEDQPTELRSLVMELNALAADNVIALATARQSSANLAHALKTPVATLALDLRGEPARAVQIARIDATIRHHLARARAETVNRRTTVLLAPAIADLVAVVRRLFSGRAITVDHQVGEGLAVAVDPTDLDEIVGNLLGNAAKHARSHVTVEASRDEADPRYVRVRIEDNGPGIPEAQRTIVTQPGVRLDEHGDGHGFGLFIASELVALYGGTLKLGDAASGGLLVSLRLPSPP